MPASTTAEDLIVQGTALARQGEFAAAIRCFDGALRLQPTDSGPWIRRGNACRDLGDSLGAIASYDEAIRLRPGIAAPWTLKGDVLRNLGDHRAAVECYDAALARHRGNGVARRGREEAIRALRRSLTVEEWVGWGLSRFEHGNYAAANECYEIALELDPMNPAALTGRASVLAGEETAPAVVEDESGGRAPERGRT